MYLKEELFLKISFTCVRRFLSSSVGKKNISELELQWRINNSENLSIAIKHKMKICKPNVTCSADKYNN